MEKELLQKIADRLGIISVTLSVLTGVLIGQILK